ncbi:MAG TPA: SRPBCC domain-containing protein [Anaerolineales bacterium]|nr:SRPBCC domain-containing protein [Anaerolineales bacterium]
MVFELAKTPIAQAGMLIRKSAGDVYEAFVDPKITTRFWFTKSSGRLEVGKHIRWEWEMYSASTTVAVKCLEPGKHILLEWNLEDQPDTVELTFTAMGKDSTFVSIQNYGFTGDGDTLV